MQMDMVVEAWYASHPDDTRHLQALDKNISVSVHFTVLQPDNVTGYLAEVDLDEMLAVLNNGYLSTPFNFTLKSHRWIVNATWALCNDTQTFKTEFKQGGNDELNVYFCDMLAYGQFVGLAQEPPIVLVPELRWKDGVLLQNPALNTKLYNTVQGTYVYDLAEMSQALIHETGHWLGLFHTFQVSRERQTERSSRYSWR